MPKVLSLIFMAGFLIGLVFALRAVMKGQRAKMWPVASGRILTSEVNYTVSRSRERGRSTSWQPHVVYEYEVDGRKYKSDKLASLNFSGSNRRAAYRKIRNYPRGQQVDVYYDPEDPTDDMLEPGVTFGGIMLVVILFALMGVAAFLFVSADATAPATTSEVSSLARLHFGDVTFGVPGRGAV